MSPSRTGVNNALGELRRSSVVMTFAPGAVVDFRAGGAAVSAVVAGLEEWDSAFPPPGLANPQTITEPRLQKKLDVDGFRLPPVADGQGETDRRALVAVRFPTWLQCPECEEIAPAGVWACEPGRAYRYCGRCSARQPAGRRVTVIPVRFVLACSSGHLDEFPWHFWVGHASGCGNDKWDGKLRLRAEGPGLAGLILSCEKCRERRPMEGIFGRDTFKDFRCKARRPWLSEEIDPQGCEAGPGRPRAQLRAVQRGASNLYFPDIRSALDIPPWSDHLQQAVGVYWASIAQVSSREERRKFVEMLATPLAEALARLRMTPSELADAMEERLAGLEATATEDLRLEEYRQLASGVDARGEEQQEFEVRNERVGPGFSPWVKRLVRVPRLREVRALIGFTRIQPPGGEGSPGLAPLASRRMRWLPAIEVRGEGIFLTLQPAALHEWEERPGVKDRVARLTEAVARDWEERHPGVALSWNVSARFLLLHTLAHALIRQLTLECGYSSASLRERLYVSEGRDGMCGLLIYTSTPDADGTLGGLERQGMERRFSVVLSNAVRSLEWCSSDPLCIEGAIGGIDTFALSACHACCLAPETSCEHYNRYLDRALLIGSADSPADGFFHELLRKGVDGEDVADQHSA